MYTIEEIENKKIWEAFLLKERGVPTPFFQSFNWGEVQKKLGNKIFRFGLYKKGKLCGICLTVKIVARRGVYFHLRHGPVLDAFSDLKPFVALIKGRALSEGVSFIRLSPLLLSEQKNSSIQSLIASRNAPIHNMDAENAWILDLSKSEEELLGQMRKTTRYLVRKAEKIGILVDKTAETQDFKKFLKLYKATSRRHHFVPHRGMEEELSIFSKDNQALLYFATFQKKLIAGALILFYGNQAVYHHGASADQYKDIPGAYLLQWEAIKEAKRQGKKYYNFWGVVPPDKPKHPWQGITLFKTGFGGSNINFVHSQDIPLKLTYWKTYFIETLRRIRKGY